MISITYKSVRNPKVWISVDFNKPHSEVFIDKKVISKYLKYILSFIRVQLCLHT